MTLPPHAAFATASAVPSRAELRNHLVRTGIAGDVATTRENNLDHYRSLALRDPYYMFGLTFSEDWTYADVLELMAKKAGVVADPAHREGQDTIDPERTIDAVEEMGDRVAEALRPGGARVIVATGHPTGLLTIHLGLARFLEAYGATLLTPAEGWSYVGGGLGRRKKIRYVDDVAMLSDGGTLVHTHDPDPMRAMLAEERPDLVIADHGWAGAAGEAGIETVGFADSNDPALFVGEAEGKIAVTVPLDDNVLPRYYRPLTAYLLDRIAQAL
ncbi:phosphatase [Planotetraspora sp. GP83]|uniref:phosphatase n=1 Tax=Planotetraspora sp. GP83 TaxID=3156264 RepID=UPI0035125C14